MGASAYVGRVGALAVGLGIGCAIAGMGSAAASPGETSGGSQVGTESVSGPTRALSSATKIGHARASTTRQAVASEDAASLGSGSIQPTSQHGSFVPSNSSATADTGNTPTAQSAAAIDQMPDRASLGVTSVSPLVAAPSAAIPAPASTVATSSPPALGAQAAPNTAAFSALSDLSIDSGPMSPVESAAFWMTRAASRREKTATMLNTATTTVTTQVANPAGALPTTAVSPAAAALPTYSALCSGGWSCNGFGAGYSAPTAGYQKAGSAGWADKYYYYSGVPSGHNCTRYAAYRLYRNGLTDPGTAWGNASKWDRRAPGVHNTTPAVGAIAWWNSGTAYAPSGHVAYVEQVGTDPANGKTYVVLSQDNAGGTFQEVRIVQGSPYWPTKFLHIKDTGQAAPAPAPTYPVGVVMVQTQRMTSATLKSQQLGWYAAGTKLSLVCHAAGQAVKGYFSFNIKGGFDSTWYKTTDGGFVADVDIQTGTLNALGPGC